MKIRSDFVTNSSSANFILELEFSNEENAIGTYLPVSPETAFSADGDMTAEGISLVPDDDTEDISFSGKSIYSVKSVDELCDLLFDGAIVEGWKGDYDEEEEEIEDEDDYYEGKTVSASQIAPKTVAGLKKGLKESGIDLNNLQEIVIKNEKFGHGDSAMFVNSNIPELEEFKKRYQQASDEDEQETVLNGIVGFMKTEPVVEVEDNEYELPPELPIVWEGSERSLIKAMKKYLEGEGPGYWMGTHAVVYTIDFTGRNVSKKEVLYIGGMESDQDETEQKAELEEQLDKEIENLNNMSFEEKLDIREELEKAIEFCEQIAADNGLEKNPGVELYTYITKTLLSDGAKIDKRMKFIRACFENVPQVTEEDIEAMQEEITEDDSDNMYELLGNFLEIGRFMDTLIDYMLSLATEDDDVEVVADRIKEILL